MRLTPNHIFFFNVAIHTVSLSFVGLLIWLVITEGLGADPVQGLSHFTGKAALNTLIITMLVSPIAKHFKQAAIMKVRRVIGLYSFFWAGLHLLGYITLDLGFDWGFTWAPKNNLQLDIFAGKSLNDSAADFFVNLGISMRFPK